jgi:hypothetical protein
LAAAQDAALKKLLKRLGIWLLAAGALAVWMGLYSRLAQLAPRFVQPAAAKAELEEAIPPPGLIFSPSSACAEPNERERALIKTAVDVLAFTSDAAGWLGIGAEKLLSNGYYRRDGQKYQRVCDALEQFERASNLIRNSDHLRRGRIVEYGLKLIARLPNPGEDLAKIVAASAFNDGIQYSEIFRNRDIRPLARSTLATLGPLARPYADRAYTQISIEDSMGTGAAQIAVAGGHPNALPTVERLMAEKLAGLSKKQVVPWDVGHRLYEMGYALAFGGLQAKEYVAPLRDLMHREVQKWAPPFGMLELPPRPMCEVLARIMQVPVADLEFKYCSDPDRPNEKQ